MTFAKDADLVRLEPLLFQTIQWNGPIQLSMGTASISTNILITFPEYLTTHLIDEGHVAIADGVPLEIFEVLTDFTATIGPIRSHRNDPTPSPVADGNIAKLTISTFLPQIEIVHEQLLRALGIDPNDNDASPSKASITNTDDFARLETLGALHLIFSAAASSLDNNDRMWNKSNLYKERFTSERAKIGISLDLNGDKKANAVRRFNTIQFTRN